MGEYTNWMSESFHAARGQTKIPVIGRINSGAHSNATIADRKLRIEAKTMANRAFHKARVAADKGLYFYNITVPQSYVDQVAKELRHYKYLVASRKALIPGSKGYSEIAVFYGHESKKLRNDKRYIELYPSLVALFLAECAAHGVTEGIRGEIDKFINLRDRGTEQFFYVSLAENIAYLMAFRDKAETVMSWANRGVYNEAQILDGVIRCFSRINKKGLIDSIKYYELMAPKDLESDRYDSVVKYVVEHKNN